jgi:hypothetical protein
VVIEKGRGLSPCFCTDEELCDEIGWEKAAQGYRSRRSAALARAVLHPSSRNPDRQET